MTTTSQAVLTRAGGALALGLALVAGPARAQQSDAGGQQAPGMAADAEIVERCRGEEHRQFDFWLGNWEVQNPDGDVIGHNDVKRVSGGCALLENWRGLGGGVGMSLNTYDPDTGRWSQRWIGAGTTLWLEGGLVDGEMVLTGTSLRTTPRGKVLDRITWTPLSDGRVRQAWDVSVDDGETWSPLFVGYYGAVDADGESNMDSAAADIDAGSLEAHARFLADDLLEGRGPASRGERLAALYLEAQLRALGLRPLPGVGDYRLPVPLTAVHITEAEAHIRISGGDAVTTLRPPAFYHPGGARTSFRDFAGELMFAGPATDALSAIDAHADLAGRVVVLTPPWAGVHRVGAELLRRGAAGAISVIPASEFYQRLRIVRGPTRYFLPDGVRDPANQSGLPQVVGGPELIRALGLEEQVGSGAVGPDGRLLGRSVEVVLPHTTDRRAGYNVAAHIPGADPALRDEWLLYVAHYDHVGYGATANGDSIWNGFIDNAAGSSMLLEIARVLAAERPARSVAFLWVTAEEQGLLGSNWFVHRPPLPLESIAAVVNLDGGAPPAPPVSWGLVGAEASRAGAAARRVIESHGWAVNPVPAGPQSDHWAFHLAGVPAIMLFPGSQLEGLSEREAQELTRKWLHPHTPDDEWSPDFPFAGLERYAALALEIGRELAGSAAGAGAEPSIETPQPSGQ